MAIALPVLFYFLSVAVIGETTPLDPSTTNIITNLMDSFRGPNAINVTRFLSIFQMPACMKQCLPEIDGLVIALSKSNDTQDIAEICSELQSSTTCAASAGCSKIFTDAAAGAFQFVCLDNIQSISESIGCVKDEALDLQPECEAQCAVQGQMIEDASNNNMEAIFDVPRVCNSTRCLLTCFKDKIDKKCQIGQKNLLDTLLSALMRGEDNGFDAALGWIMPDYCHSKNSSESSSNGSAEVPFSVGKVANSAPKRTHSEAVPEVAKTAVKPEPVKSSPALETSTGSVETALVVDGEIRTLHYQLFDWQGNPLPPPDFETLAKIMTQNLPPFAFPPERPRETVILPSERAGKEAEKRLDEEIASEDTLALQVTEEKVEADWRSEEGPELSSKEVEVTNEGVGLTIGLAIFVVTVLHWVWETCRVLS